MAVAKCLLVLGLVVASTYGANVTRPEDCTDFPCLIFEDNFDFLDHNIWEHEINMGGGGNDEFQAYINNRSISYTKDGVLFIRPDVMSNWKGEEFLASGELDLWGMNGIDDVCTSNLFDGCHRYGDAAEILPPVTSARLRTGENFFFKYGKIEVKAKMPRGDWMWPGIWLLPRRSPYGGWPTSGEMDIIEIRGNDIYGDENEDSNLWGGSTMHWGPYWPVNRYEWTKEVYMAPGNVSFSDDFFIWELEWTDDYIKVYLDGTLVQTVDPGTSFWEYGNFSSTDDNPWQGRGKMAPFDQPFYFILNVAIGGTGGYFPDDVKAVPAKPWRNDSPTAKLDFWNGRDSWYPSWTQGEVNRTSEGAALQIDYIRVYKMESALQ